MKHELSASPERLEERAQPAFNLDALTPEQVMELSAAIGVAYEAEEAASQKDRPRERVADQLVVVLGDSLKALVQQSPEKGIELFDAMSTHANPWQREMAAANLAPALLAGLDKADARRTHVADQWVGLMDDPDGVVREAAAHSHFHNLGKESPEWLDDSLVEHLGDRIPPLWYEGYARKYRKADTSERG